MDELLKVHLHDVSCYVREMCPTLARHYLLREKVLDSKGQQAVKTSSKFRKCVYCYSPYLPDNHRVRLLPKMTLSGKVRKLLQRHSEDPRSLGKFQMKLVNDYIDGRNRWAVTCFTCKKTVKIAGQSRAERYEQMQARTQANVVTEVKPKTRKEKIKEKKRKKKKNRKKLQDSDADTGLTLSDTKTGASLTPNVDGGDGGESARSKLVAAANQLPGTSSLLTKPPSEPSNENTAEKFKNPAHLSLHQQLVLNAPTSHKPSSASGSKHKHTTELLSIHKQAQTSKKKKSKHSHERLGEMLKAGKTKSKQVQLYHHSTDMPPKGKKHECHICNKTFSSRYNIQIHARVAHSGDKCFKCTETDCENTFAYKRDLKAHKTKDHGEGKTFKCQSCDKVFIYRSSCKRHQESCLATEESEVKCSACGKLFKTSDSLRHHVKYNHEKKTLKGVQCDACGKIFSRSQELRRHMHSNYHKDDK